jgi:hypothetical protein
MDHYGKHPMEIGWPVYGDNPDETIPEYTVTAVPI